MKTRSAKQKRDFKKREERKRSKRAEAKQLKKELNQKIQSRQSEPLDCQGRIIAAIANLEGVEQSRVSVNLLGVGVTTEQQSNFLRTRPAPYWNAKTKELDFAQWLFDNGCSYDAFVDGEVVVSDKTYTCIPWNNKDLYYQDNEVILKLPDVDITSVVYINDLNPDGTNGVLMRLNADGMRILNSAGSIIIKDSSWNDGLIANYTQGNPLQVVRTSMSGTEISIDGQSMPINLFKSQGNNITIYGKNIPTAVIDGMQATNLTIIADDITVHAVNATLTNPTGDPFVDLGDGVFAFIGEADNTTVYKEGITGVIVRGTDGNDCYIEQTTSLFFYKNTNQTWEALSCNPAREDAYQASLANCQAAPSKNCTNLTILPGFGEGNIAANSTTPIPSPTPSPSPIPTSVPSSSPSPIPTSVPSSSPSPVPTLIPSSSPSPAPVPTSISSSSPSPAPVPTLIPSSSPSPAPAPTLIPSSSPSPIPTSVPSSSPSPAPVPTSIPSSTPSPAPVPTLIPSSSPSPIPTSVPSSSPSPVPTSVPSSSPSPAPVPTSISSSSPSPAPAPTLIPSSSPSPIPTSVPSSSPSPIPTSVPSSSPSPIPTSVPSSSPSPIPTSVPSSSPSPIPTSVPSSSPSPVPTSVPSSSPSPVPTSVPSSSPSPVPTSVPSSSPSPIPTSVPSSSPSPVPTSVPSSSPTPQPSVIPSPTPQPSVIPSPTPTPSSTGGSWFIYLAGGGFVGLILLFGLCVALYYQQQQKREWRDKRAGDHDLDEAIDINKDQESGEKTPLMLKNSRRVRAPEVISNREAKAENEGESSEAAALIPANPAESRPLPQAGQEGVEFFPALKPFEKALEYFQRDNNTAALPIEINQSQELNELFVEYFEQENMRRETALCILTQMVGSNDGVQKELAREIPVFSTYPDSAFHKAYYKVLKGIKRELEEHESHVLPHGTSKEAEKEEGHHDAVPSNKLTHFEEATFSILLIDLNIKKALNEQNKLGALTRIKLDLKKIRNLNDYQEKWIAALTERLNLLIQACPTQQASIVVAASGMKATDVLTRSRQSRAAKAAEPASDAVPVSTTSAPTPSSPVLGEVMPVPDAAPDYEALLQRLFSRYDYNITAIVPHPEMDIATERRIRKNYIEEIGREIQSLLPALSSSLTESQREKIQLITITIKACELLDAASLELNKNAEAQFEMDREPINLARVREWLEDDNVKNCKNQCGSHSWIVNYYQELIGKFNHEIDTAKAAMSQQTREVMPKQGRSQRKRRKLAKTEDPKTSLELPKEGKKEPTRTSTPTLPALVLLDDRNRDMPSSFSRTKAIAAQQPPSQLGSKAKVMTLEQLRQKYEMLIGKRVVQGAEQERHAFYKKQFDELKEICDQIAKEIPAKLPQALRDEVVNYDDIDEVLILLNMVVETEYKDFFEFGRKAMGTLECLQKLNQISENLNKDGAIELSDINELLDAVREVIEEQSLNNGCWIDTFYQEMISKRDSIASRKPWVSFNIFSTNSDSSRAENLTAATDPSDKNVNEARLL